jgi:hypothetical protein
MSNHHRTKLIKSLEEQIEATNDPQLKADLSRQLTKVVTKPARRGRPRKPADGAVEAPKKNRSLRELCAGRYDEMSDGKLVLNHLVIQIEKRKKAGELTTRAERDAFVAEELASLTEEERAAYEALCAEGA